jgi:ubiquinone/menaquinone biosynthesis C-methylase UbiE
VRLTRVGRRALRLVARVAPSVRPGIQRALIRGLYETLSVLDRDGDMTFMNYGYAPLGIGAPELRLDADDEANRYPIQLYHRVASAVDLRGKAVLEVGCGRGGGSHFVMRYLGPRSVTGVDVAEKAIAFCTRHHRPGLSFTRGDAERLPLPTGAFDAVLNVESSHNYIRMDAFLAEVIRVLRPGGHLLFADWRPRSDMDLLREQFRGAGLQTLEEEHISPNVLRALELDSERKRALIERKVPRMLRASIGGFVALEGTHVPGMFRSGEWEYWRYVLRTPGGTGKGSGE